MTTRRFDEDRSFTLQVPGAIQIIFLKNCRCGQFETLWLLERTAQGFVYVSFNLKFSHAWNVFIGI